MNMRRKNIDNIKCKAQGKTEKHAETSMQKH